MEKVKQVEVEVMTEEAFRPFGEIIAVKQREPDFTGNGTLGWGVDFQTRSTTQVLLLSTRYQGLRFTRLERHFNVTQAFIPLGGSPSAVALAPPTDPADRESIPRPDDVRAFLIDGTRGYVLKKGTWHSLARYPLYPPASDVVILTDRETQDEITRVRSEDWKLTQVVDYGARFGVVFELALGLRP